MKIQFGNTWWGKAWLQALEKADYSNRLPRGAAYARQGAVISMYWKGATLIAAVQGTRRKPYRVTLGFSSFTKQQVSSFMDELLSHISIVTKLMHRELDPQVLDIAERLGLSIFPRSMDDIHMDCDCPDWAHLCKHIAAVVYQMSLEIDNNPFLVFTMHGLDLVKELENRGMSLSSEIKVEVPLWESLVQGEPISKEATAGKEPEDFLYPDFTKIHSLQAVFSKVLPGNPAFYPRGSFRKVYEKVMKKVQKGATYGLFDSSVIYQLSSDTDSSVLANAPEGTLVVKGLTDGLFVMPDKDPWVISRFVAALIDMSEEEAEDASFVVRFFRQACLLSLQLLRNGNVVPELVKLSQGALAIRWLPSDMDPGTAEAMGLLAKALPKERVQVKLGRTKPCMALHPLETVMSLFLTHLMKHLVGYHNQEDSLYDMFFLGEPLYKREADIKGIESTITTWISYFHTANCRWQPVLVVSDSAEGKVFDLDVSVQDTNHPEDLPISLSDVFQKKQYEKERFAILKDLDLLSALVDGMGTYMDGKGKHPISYSNENFATFLLDVIPAIKLLGAQVVLPKSLKVLLRPKRTVRVKKKEGTSSTSPSLIHLEDMLDFDWQIALGEETISPEEFEKLSIKAGSLIRFKGQYLYVTEEDLKQLEKMWQLSKSMTGEKLLRTVLAGTYEGTKISISPEVAAMIQEMKSSEPVPLPADLKATLRPYQERGYSWMYNNSRLGFGCILADDMGLGKTLQVISFLEKLREEGRLAKKKALVVVPTGLLANWQEEIARFAPKLLVFLYYGQKRNLSDFDGDILLTSYGLLRSDQDVLKKKKWEAFVIDEAQNIKNPDTAQSKAVRSVKSDVRIAMSGTPVENNMKEFWSIMEFANKGYLGTAKNFKTEYADPIQYEQDQEKAALFRRVTAPMLLRRLKTDKSIISDLPDKIEQDQYAMLTPEQAALYHETVEESLKVIESVSDKDHQSIFKRQGLVLQMILALKEICNHPAQFAKDGNWDPSLSGKATMLLDLASSIRGNKEKALIFTQFREMGDKLADFLEAKLGDRPMFLHGGCSIKERKAMVDRFQNDPKDRFFILSLKAAGTGLNLTAASHVIHYDLWWNPAVEAQATDRAYRIGQKKNVFVHRFITKDTFEEKINGIIQQKKALADMTVSVGESWIGNLDNKELRRIFG